jgi:hypothetical protein
MALDSELEELPVLVNNFASIFNIILGIFGLLPEQFVLLFDEFFSIFKRKYFLIVLGFLAKTHRTKDLLGPLAIHIQRLFVVRTDEGFSQFIVGLQTRGCGVGSLGLEDG